MIDENSRELTRVHPWMSFEEAWLLMRWSFEKNKSQDGYFGRDTLFTLMDIDFRIYQRQSEGWLKGRIKEARKKFNYEQ